VLELDPVGLLARALLRERVPELVAEACAWSVGLCDVPHYARRHGRAVASGLTLGMRADNGQQLAGEEDGRLELVDAGPGTFQDALNALAPDGRLHADRFEDDVLTPFVRDTCVQAADRFRSAAGPAWEELLDELGEDGSDLSAVVRTAEWEVPLRIDAEQLVLSALGHVPLVEVEAEGLPLSLVRAAEAETRRAAPVAEPATGPDDDALAGALFLAEAALREAQLPVPVPAAQAADLLDVLVSQGIEPDEVLELLPHLPVHVDTAEDVALRVAQLPERP
jgi:hypothetical protein